MYPSEILTKTADLLADPARWAAHHLAETATGATTTPNDPSACRFCMVGAAMRVMGLEPDPEGPSMPLGVREPLQAAIHDYTGQSLAITLFNDSSQHGDVLAVLRHAIELARAGESA